MELLEWGLRGRKWMRRAGFISCHVAVKQKQVADRFDLFWGNSLFYRELDEPFHSEKVWLQLSEIWTTSDSQTHIYSHPLKRWEQFKSQELCFFKGMVDKFSYMAQRLIQEGLKYSAK